MDPRCYFLCNSECLFNTGNPPAVNLTLTAPDAGTYIAEANFVLNIVLPEMKLNTGPDGDYFEDFALFGQFHGDKPEDISIGTPTGSFISGTDDFAMPNLGVFETVPGVFKNQSNADGDLLISFSNLDARSQSNNGKLRWNDNAAQTLVGPGTSYSFPITYRKRIRTISEGQNVYLGLTLVRSPTDLIDDNYNNWFSQTAPASAQLILEIPLPFEYNIVFENLQSNLSGIGQNVSNWRGVKGFSTNISLSTVI
jgi:hypothetical protein